eukprot:4234033-Amphidinium_carterae.1
MIGTRGGEALPLKSSSSSPPSSSTAECRLFVADWRMQLHHSGRISDHEFLPTFLRTSVLTTTIKSSTIHWGCSAAERLLQVRLQLSMSVFHAQQRDKTSLEFCCDLACFSTLRALRKGGVQSGLCDVRSGGQNATASWPNKKHV